MMENNIPGYFGRILDVNLTTGEIRKTQLSKEILKDFAGGRGLGMKLLFDRLSRPGISAFSQENVLLFMPGPFSGLPLPSSSRTCVVTKSPRTSPLKSDFPDASTVSYSNIGGFFGPELRFAGYDGLAITGKSEKPVYLYIKDDQVEIRDASAYWGMGTDELEARLIKDLGSDRFRSCYIGPAAEKLVPLASVLNTAARAAGRGGTGAVMGSKLLKAVCVSGSGIPNVADPVRFHELLEKARQSFSEDTPSRKWWREGGTSNALEESSLGGTMAVKNYSEGTFNEVQKIGTGASRKEIWKRDFACYCCYLACKKSGMAKGAYGGLVHDGPEYETGSMLGSNLLISDLAGLNKCIAVADDLGLDIISAGNIIGFLMEAYDKKLIDKAFLDGIDLPWGSVDATIALLKKMGANEGIGKKANMGVKKLAEIIGQGSEAFAIHVKGHELAGWNVHKAVDWFGISYTTANRGACHMNGGAASPQNQSALRDSLGICSFVEEWYINDISFANIMSAITGFEWSNESLEMVGERIYNLEKMFNYREGFRREDDQLPERFYTDAYTGGPAAGIRVDRLHFIQLIESYYDSRGWDKLTSKPTSDKLNELGLAYLDTGYR
ncbi:MAG: aldehyde ferredoxin oxidoreductase family protein [Lentimicrobium sp.]